MIHLAVALAVIVCVGVGLIVRQILHDTAAAVQNPANHDGYDPGSPERGYLGL